MWGTVFEIIYWIKNEHWEIKNDYYGKAGDMSNKWHIQEYSSHKYDAYRVISKH